MYFPYLYSRQAELKAISDVADSVGTPQLIFPLIEPVEPATKLINTLDRLLQHNAGAYVVINPHQGKLADANNFSRWQSDFASVLSNPKLVFPTFKENPTTTVQDISDFASTYPNRKIGIILTSTRFPPAALSAALAGTNYTAFFLPTASAANYLTALGSARAVDVSDNFRSEARNKDYFGEEWLSNNHATWQSGGRGGFSDFTILPSAYKEGGGPVGAIAIHLSYLRGTELWIQHFISSTNEQNDPQATKFQEVLADIQTQRSLTPNRFEYSPGIASYEKQYVSGNFTNLSGNKQQQISHHIFTISKLLGI